MFKNPFARPHYWRTPSGMVYTLYSDMVSKPHLLIAGATGSGKSTLLNGLLTTLLYRSPSAVQFVLCDPKRVELSKYRNLPHVVRYAGPDQIAAALVESVNIMENRFSEMEKRSLTMYDGSDLYIIIDELADLMLTDKKKYLPLLQHLTSMGRAARVHVIAATVTPTREVLPPQVRCNFDSRVGLRTATAQDSRNILQQSGCELLPDPATEGRAQCYYRAGASTTKWNLPNAADDARNLVAWWTDDRLCTARTA